MTDYEKNIWEILETVCDPEIPVLSVVDLGVVRKVDLEKDKELTVTITPTYSGCPAQIVMEANIRKALSHLKEKVDVKTVLSPAWTTDWLTENGKKKLKDFGIAPPEDDFSEIKLFRKHAAVHCPKCDSTDTTEISAFGSTACKALYKCNSCNEPFEYFKCHR